jgi:hypothetical protein
MAAALLALGPARGLSRWRDRPAAQNVGKGSNEGPPDEPAPGLGVTAGPDPEDRGVD